MTQFSDYHHRKARLDALYRQLQQAPFLPLSIHGKTLTADSLEGDRGRLEAEKFVVSVCGQVNVGKSTFINALLFEDEVLPAADTVETAKLSEIFYGEEPSYEIVLYSLAEWQALQQAQVTRDDGTAVSYYEAYIKPAMDHYIEESGELLYPEQILAQGTLRGTDLSDLRQFISAKGKYTPFVRFVRIAYPAEILKEVTFVDTPGTNDPNPLRSKITLDWIGSSDAVIFLMYAGAALAQQDMAFVDQYLRPVPSDRILIALSKADVVEDYRRPKSYVEQVLQSVPGFAKTLKHKDPYAIAPIFSLYPRLLERHKRGEIQLPPAKLKRIQHQLFGRPDKDFSELEEQQGFIPAFREAIFAHLLATKGDGILASHAQKIRTAYEYALQARQIEAAQLQQSVADARLSDQELREKRRAITEVREKLDRMVVEVRHEKDNILNPFKDATRRLVREMGTAIQVKASELIRNGEIDRLKRNLAWDLKNVFETQAEEVFKPAIEKEFKKAKSDIQLLFDRLKESAFNLDLFDGVFLQLVFRQFYITDLLEGLSKGINERFTERFLEKQRVNNFFFFQDKENTAANVEAAIKEFFDSDGPWAQAIVGYAHGQFQLNVNNTFADINQTLEGELNRTSKDVEALLNNLESKAQRLEGLQRQLLGVEREVHETERELARINQELAGEPAAATA